MQAYLSNGTMTSAPTREWTRMSVLFASMSVARVSSKRRT